MNDARALEEAKRLARGGQVVYLPHARRRMAERGAGRIDVINAILTATSAHYQVDRDNWQIRGGCDRGGDALTVIAYFAANLMIITVF